MQTMLASGGLLALLTTLVAGEEKPAPTQKLRIRYHPAGKALSPIDEPWALTYEYSVPAKEPAKEWDPKEGVFFIWGDTDFDSYGPRNESLRIHEYVYNQIVPQLVIGKTLAANDDKYNPGWFIFDDWQIQAQYFWQRLPKAAPLSTDSATTGKSRVWSPSLLRQLPSAAGSAAAAATTAAAAGGPKPQMGTNCEGNGTIFCALCGEGVPVKAGDLITTVIAYDGKGAMSASISATTPGTLDCMRGYATS